MALHSEEKEIPPSLNSLSYVADTDTQEYVLVSCCSVSSRNRPNHSHFLPVLTQDAVYCLHFHDTIDSILDINKYNIMLASGSESNTTQVFI